MKNISRFIPACAALTAAVLCLSWLAAQQAWSVVKVGQSIAMMRTVTPNGDNRNDTFKFRCYNPRQLAVTGKIFNMKGSEVAVMKLIDTPLNTYYYLLEWDPNSGGKAPGGLYLYQIIVEDQVYKGAVAVIR